MSTKTKNESALCVTEFRKMWAALRAVMPRKATLPLIEYLKVTSTGSTIALQATDLEVFLTIRIDQKDGETWETLVHQSVLNEALKGKPGKETIRFEKEQIVFGNGMICPIEKPIDIEGFPAPKQPQDAEAVSIPVSEVVTAGRYASTEVARPTMNGVFVNPVQNEIAATDGRRLIVLPKENEHVDKPSFIIPNGTVTALSKVQNFLPDVVRCQVGINHAAEISSKRITLSTKLVEGNYPNYHQIIPKLSKFGTTIILPDETKDLSKWLRASKVGNALIYQDGDDAVIEIIQKISGKWKTIGKKLAGFAISKKELKRDDGIALGLGLLADLLEDVDTLHVKEEDPKHPAYNPLAGSKNGMLSTVLMPLRLK